ncbi:MAG: phosphoenolpyruvate--protein phosphotransferase [Mycoplasmataceae bacterium]|nr:phosphoenolpyruvate--protein phosphotransferase [Mycoplasmataceae bacterium]
MKNLLRGIGASSGVSFAKVFELAETEVKIKKTTITDIEAEKKKVEESIKDAISQIMIIKEKALENLGPEEAAVFDAHIQVASDPVMIDEIVVLIESEKINALYATSIVTTKYADMFESMEDAYMKERAADIKDVSKRIINFLAGVESTDVSSINEEVIVVAVDLTPSDTAQLNKKFVKGFITDIGGRTSHAAIMARTLEIPAVLGLNNITTKIKTGDIVAMDGDTGEIIINPTKEQIQIIKDKARTFLHEKQENLKFIGKESMTVDGHEIELAANIGSPNDIEGANANDAEGVGLFRSEFLYMDAKDWPTEDEQFESYSRVLKGMNGKRVVVRTLDIGGDKILSYFKFPEEMNPFLGYRAIRLSLDKKDIFKTQLRALLRASNHGKLAIMFPMIATIEEFLEAKGEYEKAKKSLEEDGIKYADNIEVGMMVEIPAAAILSKQFARHSDFLSIGTNDLMQYTMAADRMNEKVSYLYQPLNPSILSLINMTIKGAHAEGKWVGMCGEMAGDKNAIPLLLGMGLDEFSMSSSSILGARRQISKINYKDAQKLVIEALDMDTQKDVQKLVDNFNK